MNLLLGLLCGIVFMLAVGLLGTDGFVATAFSSIISLGVIFILRKYSDEDEKLFLTRLFLGALIVRLVLCITAFGFDFQIYLASDYVVYESRGFELYSYWIGSASTISEISRYYIFDSASIGSAMYYLVAVIYLITERNPLAASLFCGVVGAATVPLVYYCTYGIYSNRNAAKYAAFSIAFFPAFVVWSSFLLKDGLMMFFLVLTVFSLSRLQKSFSYFHVGLIIVSLVMIVGLRFYIFPVIALGIFASLVIGTQNSVRSLMSRILTTVFLGVVLSYFGVTALVQQNVTTYGSAEKLQNSRSDLAQSGDSGFGRDMDVSTFQGAVGALPIGFTYLLLAPFPWEITSLRAALTLPDTVIWWLSIPFMISGIMFAIKSKLKENVAILIFVLTLSLFYSIFQGNVGTAYRQRTQIQVFMFMFIAVGVEVAREKYENKRLLANAGRKRFQVKNVA
jgi:4-amino-4-deoxy-L-arabinose transferase-like glycosyltransferase